MGKYVDGFVLPLNAEHVESYRVVAEKAGRIWRAHGALEYVESVLDDPDAHDMIPFREMAGAGEGQTVVFAWAVFASKEQRDAANTAIMNDPEMKAIMEDQTTPLFDYTRMAYGGFRVIVENR